MPLLYVNALTYNSGMGTGIGWSGGITAAIGYGSNFLDLSSLSWGSGPDCGSGGPLCDPEDIVVTLVSGCSGYICEYFCEDKGTE
jgi:hypothetical protein